MARFLGYTYGGGFSAGYNTYGGGFAYYNRKNVNIHEITPNENGELVLANLQSFPQNISKIDVYKIDSDISIDKGAVSQTISNDTTISNSYTATISNGYAIRIDKNLYTVKEEDLAKLSNPNQIIVKANDGSFVTINTDQSQNFSLSNDPLAGVKAIEPQKDLVAFVNSHDNTFAIVAVALLGTIFILQLVAAVCIGVLKYINKKKLHDIASNLGQIVNRKATEGQADLSDIQKQDIKEIITLISDAAISIDRYYCCHYGIIDEMSSRMDSNQLTHKALSQLNKFCETNGIQQDKSNISNLQKALEKDSSLEAKIEELKILTDAVVLYGQKAEPKMDITQLESNDNSNQNLETTADDDKAQTNTFSKTNHGRKGCNGDICVSNF